MTREEAYAAIFGLLAPLGPTGTATFVTVSRRLQLVETFDGAGMPAIFQQQLTEPPGEFALDVGFVGATLNLCWYIYVQQSDDDAPMSPPLNALVDAVFAQCFVAPDGSVPPGDVITVGDAVFSVRPTGVAFWEGLLGDKAVARISLTARSISS